MMEAQGRGAAQEAPLQAAMIAIIEDLIRKMEEVALMPHASRDKTTIICCMMLTLESRKVLRQVKLKI